MGNDRRGSERVVPQDDDDDNNISCWAPLDYIVAELVACNS